MRPLYRYGVAFKNNLAFYRRLNGMTQDDLAVFVGCSKNTIFAIETGKYSPTAHLAYWLCHALGCKFEDLFYVEFEDDL